MWKLEAFSGLYRDGGDIWCLAAQVVTFLDIQWLGEGMGVILMWDLYYFDFYVYFNTFV